MIGNRATIANLLNASSAYRIPPYQRAYQWNDERWHGVAHDVYELTSKPSTDPPHWLGIMLLSEDTGTVFPGADSGVRLYTVIDGQQRLTTTVLWLAALAHHAKDVGNPISLDVTKFAQIEVQEIDKLPFRVALEGKWRLAKHANLLERRPLQAYAYFRWLLHLGTDALLEEGKVKHRQLKPVKEAGTFEEQWDKYLLSKRGAALPRGVAVDPELLAKSTRYEMTVYTLIHEPNIDESQATIFDTLNGMRTPLQPLDHVRNSLFVRLPEPLARSLYEGNWRDAEDVIRRVPTRRMSPEKMFLYDYLISRGEKARQKTVNANRGAEHFSVATRGLTDTALETFITDDLLPAMAAWPIVVRDKDEYRLTGVTVKIPRKSLELLDSIRELSTNPANPIALHFVAAFGDGGISANELELALGYTEAYLARQLLAGRPLSPLRSKIMDVMGKLDRSLDPAALLKQLKASDWATDKEIEDASETKPLYSRLSPTAVLALLRGMERELSGPGSMFFRSGAGKGDYSIEHVFPQKKTKWESDIAAWGADEHAMDRLLHSLGNLAVVTNAHNSSVGNDTFAKKQAYPATRGKAAPLSINADWRSAAKWTDAEMRTRGKSLVETALKRWSP